PRRLEPAVVRALRALMPAVVVEGTASAVSFPSGTAGKTGTAEYGTGKEPPSHAWFIGYRGDLAFSVVVEGGGAGSKVAAPVAARFLKALS
ncbi:penicillin-binding transpeptidase domain-containing protein, partial [Streptosporangium algeriense]